jgi:hypothetical protein
MFMYDRGTLVPVWEQFPNTPLQTGVCPMILIMFLCAYLMLRDFW